MSASPHRLTVVDGGRHGISYCPWCRWMRGDGYYGYWCADPHNNPLGTRHAGSIYNFNSSGECKRFLPSLWTRLVRRLGGRRPWRQT